MNVEEMKALAPDKQATLVKKIDAARKKGKATNYSATYGAGPPTIARSAGVSEVEGKKLHEAYWKLNWSIPAISDRVMTKTVRKQKWLYNPVSRLWYSLRHDKDKWSTLNQGTGVWCFDTWVKYIRESGFEITAQFHDEVCVSVVRGNESLVKTALIDAIKSANNELNLNRELDIDIQFGVNYSEIH